jgi:hypothetical protein
MVCTLRKGKCFVVDGDGNAVLAPTLLLHGNASGG